MKTLKSLFFLIIISLILSSCSRIDPLDFHGFREPEPQAYVQLLPIVQEYFYQRKQAVLSGALDIFFQSYLPLAEGADLEKGVNCEAYLVQSMHTLQPIDGNIHPEYYEKIKIKESQTDLEILVHGMELYLWQDTDGTLMESGGEFKLQLHLQKKDGTWQVVKTDQVTLAEWHGFDQ